MKASRDEMLAMSGDHIYLANPAQLSVLGIRIAAQCTVEELEAEQEAGPLPPLSRNQEQKLQQQHLPSSPHAWSANTPNEGVASTSQRASNVGPPSSFKDPSQSRDPVRRRPRSAELGAKAKEAMIDFGRAARELPRGLYGLRNLSRSDVSDTRDSMIVISPSMDDTNDLIATASPTILPNCPSTEQPFPSTEVEEAPTRMHTVRSILRVRRIYRLRPRSTALTQDLRLASNRVPMNITCRTEMRCATSSGDDSGWEKLDCSPAEFVGNEEDVGWSSLDERRAGVFQAISRTGSEDHESEMDSTQDSAFSDMVHPHSIPLAEADRPLLKVASPVQSFLFAAGKERLARGWRNDVVLKMRLRTSSQENATNVTAHLSPASPRLIPAGPRSQRSNSGVSSIPFGQPDEQQIVFLSCNSAHKLLDAINATQAKQGRLSGPLASYASAKLEGIDWAPVRTSSSPNPIDFEWTWRDLDMVTKERAQSSAADQQVKCACAFATVNMADGKMQAMVFFQFVIHDASASANNRGAPPSAWNRKTAQLEVLENVSKPRRSSRSEELFGGQAVGLGLEGVDGQEAARSDGATSNTFLSPHLTSGSRQVRSRHILTPASTPANPASVPQQLSVSEELFASPRERTVSSHASPSVQNAALEVNHIGISLEDVENDSPIYRAALQGSDRRTMNLKRAVKTVLKAADEVSEAINVLQVSEVQLDHTLEDVANMMPATFGFLSSQLLLKSREADRARRDQTKTMLETHIVAPMNALADMCREVTGQLKAFDVESKAYYSATQKWLSCRGANGQGTDVYSPEAVGFDKAILKQEKLDEKQRLRQARFDFARFDVYRSVCALHAGEAELLTASHMLALCRSQCTGERVSAAMHEFGAAAQSELVKVRAHANTVRARCQELEVGLIEQQQLLGRDLELQSVGCDSVGVHESEHHVGAATRQAGHKLKTLLSSLGMGPSNTTFASNSTRQPFSCPIPPVAPFEQLDQDDQATIDGTNLNAPSSNNVSSSMGPSSTGKWQTRLRTFSFTKQGQSNGGEVRPEDREPSIHTMLQPNQQCAEPIEADRTVVPDPAISPSPRRSWSMSGKDSSKKPAAMLDAISRSVNSPGRQQSTASRSESDPSDRLLPPTAVEWGAAPKPTAAVSSALPAHMISQTSNASQRLPVQPSRKKEGILWAMTKPIHAVGGGDAPRAVSRAQNWRECWVVLSGSGHLGEFAHWKDAKAMTLEPSQPLIDLRFATVREARGVERRFTFEVVTRENRRFFQAPNEDDMRGWIVAIGLAIESLINGTSSVRQIEKVVRNSVAISDSFGGSSNDFGMRHVFDGTAQQSIGIHKAFSQSLTDLGSAAGGRLFNRVNASREEGGRKRDSKGTNVPRGHLLALSEGHTQDDDLALMTDADASGVPITPLRDNNHMRGISNTTPVSGYIGPLKEADNFNRARQLVGPSDDDGSPSRSSLDVNTDFDRRIEAIVLSNYGGTPANSTSASGSGFHSRARSANRDSLLTSASASRVPSSTGQTSADEENRLMSLPEPVEGSSKFSRAREILALASRQDNCFCADCRKPDPRWASWSLNGEKRCIFICISCSGIHRGLGVSVSKVRSVDLDEWNEEQLQSAREWGNVRVNALYEACKPHECTVASMGDSRTKAFWTAKYVDKAWFASLSLHDEEQESRESGTRLADTTCRSDDNNVKVQGTPPASDDRPRKHRPPSLVLTQGNSTTALQQSLAHNRMRASLPPSSTGSAMTSARWHSFDALANPNPDSPMPRITT